MGLPSETEVCIVGAGPTGLALATCLALHGTPFVLVERLERPQPASRAAAVHARTLEVLEPLGVTDTMVAAGRPIATVGLHDRDTTLMRIDFGLIQSRYRYILTLPQDRTEAILTERLGALGGGIARGQEAVALDQDASGVTVTVREAAGSTRSVRARYVVGADGFHSLVRQQAGIGFSPGTYAESFILADVHMDFPWGSDALRLFLAPSGMLLVAPFSETRFRIVATVDQAPEHPDIPDVQAIMDERGPRSSKARIWDLVWSSRFRIHHGVAERYRAGRAFLAGDAAHVHSPAGGQGMNTGIQDAIVLGDRLAAVIAGRRPETELDLYERERRPVAERVVRMTDQMTRMGTLGNPIGQRLRNIGLRVAGQLAPVRRKLATRMAELDNPKSESTL